MTGSFSKNINVIFLFLIFCTFQTVYSQNIDSELLNKLKVAKQDSLKIKLLIDIGDDQYYSFPDTSYAYYTKANILSKQLKNKKLEALSFLKIGFYLDDNERYKESLEHYLKAIELFKSINDENGIAECYTYIGYGFANLNLPNKSIEYYFKALKIFENLNDSIGIASVNNGFGSLYYDVKNYSESFKYYKKAFDIYKKLNDEEGLVAEYINLGNSISELGKIDEGLVYYFKSVKLCEKLGDEEGLVMNYTNIGDCYLVKNDYEKAMEYFEKAIKLSNAISYKYQIPIIYANIAHTKLNQKNYASAIHYANKSILESKKLSQAYYEYDNHKYLSECYEKLEDFENAYKQQKLYKKYTDSVFNTRKYEQIAKLSVIYELESKEQKIDLLLEHDEINMLKIQNQKKANLTLIISTIILLGLFLVLFVQNKSKNKTLELLKVEKEKATESDRLKSAFLANMSHEIRTPMNAIIGFSEFLKNPDLPKEKQNKFVDIIIKSGVRLMNIINDIIDISKIESNQLKLELKDVEIVSVFKDIIEIQKKSNPIFLAKNIELKINLLNNSDGITIRTDENRFTQVLNNLINNAIKFTDEGYVEVGFSKKQYENKKYIEFYVKDTGSGIEANKFDVIFDRFSQAGEKDFKTGNGLGLSICKGILKLLKGDIWLQSKVGEGTTFYFTLPYNF